MKSFTYLAGHHPKEGAKKNGKAKMSEIERTLSSIGIVVNVDEIG